MDVGIDQNQILLIQNGKTFVRKKEEREKRLILLKNLLPTHLSLRLQQKGEKSGAKQLKFHSAIGNFGHYQFLPKG